MKKVVVDTNIIFSSLLSQNNRYREVIFSEEYEKYSCNFAFTEIFKYKHKILKNSKIEESDLLISMNKILNNIIFISDLLISEANYYKAFQLCKDIDKKDFLFVALTFDLNCQFWTGDKQLKKGLIDKGINIFFD